MSSFLPFHGFSYTVALELAFRIQKNTTVLASFYYWGGGGGRRADRRALAGPPPAPPRPLPLGPLPEAVSPGTIAPEAGGGGERNGRPARQHLPAPRHSAPPQPAGGARARLAGSGPEAAVAPVTAERFPTEAAAGAEV